MANAANDGTIIDLGTPGTTSAATAANNRGQVVGYSTLNVEPRAVLWDNGYLTNLGVLGTPVGIIPWSGAYGINDAGQIVGYSMTSAGTSHAFLWERGTMRDLGTLPGGSYSVAYAINARGQVVGECGTAQGQQHACLWDKGQLRDLGTLGGSFSTARAISDAGVIVGFSTTPSGDSVPFVWENGVMKPIPPASPGLAENVNNRGQIVGVTAAGRPFLVDRGALRDLGTLGGTTAAAWGINSQGQIVGTSALPGDTEAKAFLWENGLMRELPTLGGSFTLAAAITDSGYVVGESMTAAGELHAFVLRVK
jgi:probable HAF family extracellular repeat protein